MKLIATHTLALHHTDGTTSGDLLTLNASEPEEGDVDEVVLEASWRGRCARHAGGDWFSALASVRAELAKEGLRPNCYGSALDVFHSSMSRSMGFGERAYRHRLGKPALMADLVYIFDPAREAVLADPSEQLEFQQRWADSLD